MTLSRKFDAGRAWPVAIGLILVALAGVAWAGGPSTTLNNYQVQLHGGIVGPDPILFTKLENNGEILVACVGGKTAEQLKAEGIPCQSNQIKLLVQNRLLHMDGDLLKTAFPILSPAQTQSVRALTTDHGYKLGHKIHKDLKELREKLQTAKRLNSHYTILYSYILNDLVFRRLEDQGHLQKYAVKAATPSWSGRVWAVYPPREFSCQSRTFTYQGLQLRVNWNQAAMDKLEPFFEGKKHIDQFLAGYKKMKRILDPAAKKALNPYNVCDDDGDITLPLIVEKRGEPLYERCVPIAETVADYLVKDMGLDGWQDRLGLPDREITMLVVYYELVWDMLKYLETQGLTRKPEAFAFPRRSQTGDMGDLMYLVSKERMRRR